MLIRIDHSILIDQNIDLLPAETLLALEILAIARREGKHAVIADRETSKQIYKCKQLSVFAQKIYENIFIDFTYVNAHISNVKMYIEVSTSCIEATLTYHSEKKIIKVPPKFFIDSESIQKSILLCENSDDSKFYEFIAKVCMKWNHQNLFLASEHRGGGGNTISREFKNIQALRNGSISPLR